MKPLKVQERELSWLTTEQIAELLEEIRRGCDNPHVEIIALICLATGARWSEAEKLKPTGLRNGVITFSGTKNGKVRSVPITAELEAKIVRHWKQHGQPNSAITSFRRALARTTIRLPKGQAAHALRHLRQPLHPERQQHPHPAENPGSFQPGHDHALCTPGARSSAGCC